MYAFLSAHLPPRVAELLTAIWYATLILLTLKFGLQAGHGEFRYGEM